MLLLSGCILLIIRHAFSAVPLDTSIAGAYFVLRNKCSAEILQLKVAKLQLNFGILLQNCNWIFSLISSPFFIHICKKCSKVREWFLIQGENTLIANDYLCDWNPEKDSRNGN